ncbi:MAG TPA: phosphatidate cytidylyltransferase [Acidimicrobiales bacterium]|nr:phosphatidate cytidylyltransferase [Acidimicrobiales bacterium]
MTDGEDRRQNRHRDPTEGVRLLGADEAAEAMERDDIRRRLGDDEPRFGDRPAAPPTEGPRPALRFPLGSYDDPNQIERPPVVPVQRRTEAPELSHWAGSAAEEVPNMNRRDPRQGDEGWSDPGADPRWREDPTAEPTRAQPHVPRHAAGGAPGGPPPAPPGPPPGGGGWGDPSVPPAPAPGPGPATGRGRRIRGTPVSFEEGGDPPPGRSVFDGTGPGAAPAGQGYDDGYGDDAYGEDYDGYGEPYGDEVYDDEVYAEPGYGPPGADGVAAGTYAPPRRGRSSRRAPDRDLRTAVLVAVAFAAVVLALLKFLGPLGGMIVVVPVLAYATYEYFVAINTAGFAAPMPVGVAASAGLAIAAYNYGEPAIPLILVLATAVGFLWYLVGAGGDRPVANIGVTLLGVGWIGLFGSFAALLLAGPHGVALLLAAVIPTIGYDVGALFVGRSAGSRPLSAASPNKTIEGLAGGMFLAVVAAVVFALVKVTPFDTWQEGLKLGLLVALVAPLGDLAESLLKRDLGIKDMGSILPGHGGLLDRFDALLFVLPAVWYLARLSDFFLR